MPDSGDELTVNKNCTVKNEGDDSEQDEDLVQEKKYFNFKKCRY